MLERYKKENIIAECQEDILDPLISNLIPLKKGNTGEVRLVFDGRPQNYFARKNKTYHTSLFETLRSVDLNATHVSVIDLSSSY